jgi:histidine ammonia-lyase
MGAREAGAVTAPPVTVGPGAPSIDDVVAVARGGAGVVLSAEALGEIERTRAVVDALARDARPHYGISTGFGALALRHIPPERRAQLQRSLIRSHAAGSGDEVEPEVVRALMFLRLSTLATGRTGIRPETATVYAATLSRSRAKAPCATATGGDDLPPRRWPRPGSRRSRWPRRRASR